MPSKNSKKLKPIRKKKMRFVNLFVLAVLSACGTKLPPVPQHEQMAIIEKTPVENSYVYVVPYYDSKQDYKITIREFLDRKPICISADDYGTLKKYAQTVIEKVKKKCPALVP